MTIGSIYGKMSLFAAVLSCCCGILSAQDTADNSSQGLRSGSPQATGTDATESDSGNTGATSAESGTSLALQEQIQTRIAQVAADASLDEQIKATLAKLHEQALLNIEQAKQLAQKQSELAADAQQAPERIKNTQEALDDVAESPLQEEELKYLSFDEAGAWLQKLQAESVSLNAAVNELDTEITRREGRRAELPEAIGKLKTELENSESKADESTGNDLLDEAQQWLASTARQVMKARLLVMETEQLAYDSEASLLPLQVKQAARARTTNKKLVLALEKELGKRRLTQILGYQDRFRSSPLAGENAELNLQLKKWLGIEQTPDEAESIPLDGPDTEWVTLVRDHALIRDEQIEIASLLKTWNERKTKMEGRVESNGQADSMSRFNSWVGLMLRKQRSELPSQDEQLLKLNAIQLELQKSDAWLIELEYASTTLGSPVAESDLQNGEGQGAQPTLSREIVAEMRKDVESYIYDLYEVASTRQELYRFTVNYKKFIDKHILWIRSSETFGGKDIQSLVATVNWLRKPEKWSELGSAVFHDSSRRFVWYILGGASLFLLLLNRPRIVTRLNELSQIASRKTCTNYLPTFRGALLTVFLASPLPLLFLFLGWRIEFAVQNWEIESEAFELGKALSVGCIWASAVLFPLEVIRQICRDDGLAEKHFDWEERNVATIRGNLLWFVLIGSPLVFLTYAFASQTTARFDASFGRLTFMLLMVALAVFFMRVCWPTTGVFHHYISQRQGGWADRLRYLWYPALVMGPLALGVLSFAGFHYTARQITGHLLVTLWMLLLLGFAYYLVKRWLLIGRRRLMMEQARQRLEQAAGRDGEQSTPASESAVDMVAINEQTKRLVTSLVVTFGLVGVFLVWQDVLPAVSVLDRFELWEVKGETPEDTVSITLANVLIVIPIVILTVVATRNVPGLLEIAFLQHLPLTDAVRYAITTLARYVIVAFGIVIASSMIGLQWSGIQWLVAALGVGLGFGLQEIVANFVSGIILLFEQPIRVGDIITVGGTTGTVTKIRIRATTVVNWDRQELIIPNKDLITGTLLNWTLTDTTNRIVLNIGIAYGSDTKQACEIVRQVTTDHPEIMDDPSPIITFEGFGDNTLNLVLRAYLATLDNRLGTIHELHHQIYEALNEAKIDIAFPQRDLHLKSIPESLSSLLKPDPDQPTSSRKTSTVN